VSPLAKNVPIVPGFQYDLFISYAHRNDVAWKKDGSGWVTDFVKSLKFELEARSRNFAIWFDPQLRTGEDFNEAIGKAISQSAVFLIILSPAYDDCPYCKKEVVTFREQGHPAFGLRVGTLSRMQALVLEDFPEDEWPPEIRTTSPYRFYATNVARFHKPDEPDEKNPYVQGLWKVRDSVWAVLDEMRRQKANGTAIEHSYGVQSSSGTDKPTVYLADVTDALYYKRERLKSALEQLSRFEVGLLPNLSVPTGSSTLSVHLLDQFSGRPFSGKDVSLSRLQLQAAIAAAPVRRPIVWLARDLTPELADTEGHRQFLESLLSQNGVELLRTGFEDLSDEIQKRMTLRTNALLGRLRRSREDPIVHVWHQAAGPEPLAPLRKWLQQNRCAISVFSWSEPAQEKLQSKLAYCDGLVVSYTADMRSWAEDVMSETFQLRRREERPLAFAAVELPPASGSDFNFEHPRVIPVQGTPAGEFSGMERFLAELAEDDV
jgi:hypothetical protein